MEAGCCSPQFSGPGQIPQMARSPSSASNDISSPRRAPSYTPEAADEGKFLKVTLFGTSTAIAAVVNSFNDQCRKMAETTSDNAVAAAQSERGDLYATGLEHAGNGSARHHRDPALAGETLTATKDRIEDEDGLTGAVSVAYLESGWSTWR